MQKKIRQVIAQALIQAGLYESVGGSHSYWLHYAGCCAYLPSQLPPDLVSFGP
jgi:hypothetical protein